ncbi:unnamed protein product, partial [Hapterophycus canaliculatus]
VFGRVLTIFVCCGALKRLRVTGGTEHAWKGILHKRARLEPPGARVPPRGLVFSPACWLFLLVHTFLCKFHEREVSWPSMRGWVMNVVHTLWPPVFSTSSLVDVENKNAGVGESSRCFFGNGRQLTRGIEAFRSWLWWTLFA